MSLPKLSILLILISFSAVGADAATCTAPKERNPQVLFEDLNEFAITTLDRMEEISLRAADAQAQATTIRMKVIEKIEEFEGAAACLLASGAVSNENYKILQNQAKILRKITVESKPSGILDAKLDQQFQSNGNDPTEAYPLRQHNRLRFLDTGDDHRDAVFETIRSARRFIHLSYFELYPDRMGTLVAAALIAKRIGKNKPCEIAQVADALGLSAPLNRDVCEDVPFTLGPIPKIEFQLPSKNELLKRAQALLDANREKLGAVDVKIYLDNSKKSYGKLKSKGVAQALELFGIPFRIEGNGFPINIYNNNHTKITASEHRAVISGGNIVDKVMDWTTTRTWRDAAIYAEGELVNDINHFYLAKFKGIRHMDLNSKLCPGETPACLAEYFPPENMNRADFTAPGRLIWTSNYDAKISPTFIAIDQVVKEAKHSLYFENAFFSDFLILTLLHRKAITWNLKQSKNNNSAYPEKGDESTCGPGYFEKVKKRPGQRYMLLLLPRDSDQIFVKLVERVLTNFLVKAGVDVCKWRGKLDNQFNKQHDGRVFKDETMLHTKVFMADDEIAYVGTANLNKRSMLGKFDYLPGALIPAADLEVGILTRDAKVVGDIKTKMFEHDVRAAEPVQFHFYNYFLFPLQVVLNVLGFT